jgi:hypothetical protein
MIARIRVAIVGSMIALAVLPARVEAADGGSVQIGGDVGALASWYAGSFSGADVRVGVPVSERHDVETFVGVARPSTSETLGFYGVMLKRRLRAVRTSGTQPFLSFGGAGIAYFDRNNSIVTPPFAGVVGGGVEQRIHDRLTVRVEAQTLTLFVVPVAVRVMTGISVPIGRATRSGL